MGGPASAATDLTPVMREELASLELAGVEDFLAGIDHEVKDLMPKWQPEQWVKNGLQIDLMGLIRGLWQMAIGEVVLNLRLLVQILIIAIVGALLAKLQTGWVNDSVAEMAFSLTYLVLAGLAIGSFITTGKIAQETLSGAATFFHALLPTLFTLLVAAGNLTTVATMHPVMLLGISLMIQVIRDWVLPIALMAGVVSLVGCLDEGFSLSRLAKLLRQVVTGGLGLLMTIFLGVVSVMGLSVAVTDGISFKTVKYVTGSFLPVVGGALADSMELAAGCSLLLKSVLGAFGAIGILVLCLAPMIKIYVVSLIYRMASALAQPLGNERLSLALQEIADTFVLIFAALAIVGLMFFIALTLLVGVGNIAAMLR